MNNRFRSIVLVVLIGMLTSAVAQSVDVHRTERLARELALTEAQQEGLAALRAEYAPTREAFDTSREEVIALVKSGSVDAAAELAASHARDRVYRRAEMHRRLAEILTPEQLAQMDEHRSGRSGRHGSDRIHKRRHGRCHTNENEVSK